MTALSLETTSRVLPALVVTIYFLGGLCLYAGFIALRGVHEDQELAKRGSSRMLGRWLRMYFAWVTQPIWLVLRVCRATPAGLTVTSLVLALASGVAVGFGQLGTAGALFILGGVLDFFDGRLARATGSSSPRGEALDSILDRYGDSALLVGLAWFFRDSWVLLVVLAALVGASLVPYIRAKGESLGVDVRVGLMQRPERIALMGASLLLTGVVDALFPAFPPNTLLIAAISVLALGTQATALLRLGVVLRALVAAPKPEHQLDPNLRRGWFVGRGSLGRSSFAAILATCVDFCLVVVLVTYLSTPVWEATAIGCLLGAAVNFSINRWYTFISMGNPVVQAGRYAAVSGASAAFNTGAVGLLVLLPVDYRLVWWLARLVIFALWNYPMHRYFVFPAHQDRALEAKAPLLSRQR